MQYPLCHTCYEGCQGADHDLQCKRPQRYPVLSQLLLLSFPCSRVCHWSSLLVMFQYCILSYKPIENLRGGDVPYSADQIVPGLLVLLILRERVSCSLVNSSSLVSQVISFSVMVLQLMFFHSLQKQALLSEALTM